MMKHTTKAALAGAVAGFALIAGVAQADTVSALEARIAKLEEAAAKKGTVTTATGTNLTFYGYARLDGYKDFDYNLGVHSGGFATVDPTTPAYDKFGGHAYQSRIGVRGAWGDAKVNVEGDFYGSNGSFRLRHAYGEYGGFIFGQTWSNWNADYNPAATLDFGGTAGNGAGYRAVQVRYTHKFSDSLTLSASVEDDSASYKALPLVTAALRYSAGTTNVKLSLVSRKLETMTGDDVSGWGGSIGVGAQPWEGGSVTGVVMMGEAIGSLVNFSGGVGQQAGGPVKGTYDIDANGDAIGMKGVAFGVIQALSPKWDVGVSYGRYDYDDFAGSVASSTDKIDTTFLTVKYKPQDNVFLALEYQMLDKKLMGGDKLSADRLMAVAQFSF